MTGTIVIRTIAPVRQDVRRHPTPARILQRPVLTRRVAYFGRYPASPQTRHDLGVPRRPKGPDELAVAT